MTSDSGGPSERDDPLGALAETEAGEGRSLDDEASAAPGVPSRIGRFVVMDVLGEGGMGAVYSAYDPKLQRVVALKRLRAGRDDDAAMARLVREAQAMAALSHPNVLPVFEVDERDGQAFVAMERVLGRTLRAWLRERRRSWIEVLGVFEQAALGLAAAHREGLTHRDFKPDNVMVGDDGRVRVMDFGLVRRAGEPDRESSDTSAHPDAAPDAPDDDLTRSGAMLGTPAYMSPEQYEHHDVDARTDQFSFCVALWEGLYGQRPFAGKTLASLAAAVIDGQRRPPPPGVPVPGWLRRVCERGMAREPTQRFASMEALLDAVHRGQRTRRRLRGAGALGAVAVLGAASLGYARWSEAKLDARCETAARDDARRWWSDSIRDGLREALLATGLPYAETSARTAVTGLDRYAEAWVDAGTRACRAHDVEGSLDDDDYAKTRWCLELRGTQARLLVESLREAEGGAEVAVAAVHALERPDGCEPSRRLADAPEPDQRDAQLGLRTELARVRALDGIGHSNEAATAAEALVEAATTLADASVRAAAEHLLGNSLHVLGQFERAQDVLESAYFGAARQGDLELAARAAAALGYLVGNDLGRTEEGLLWGEHAATRLVELGVPENDARWADQLMPQGVVHYDRAEYPIALEAFERSARLLRSSHGDAHPSVARALNNVGMTQLAAGDLDGARDNYEASRALLEAALGAEHPAVGAAVHNLATVAYTRGDATRAVELLEQAVAIREHALGREHPDVAQSLVNLGSILGTLGRADEARAALERAATIQTRAFGKDSLALAYTEHGLGNLAMAAGDLQEASTRLARSLEIRERVQGPEHPEVAVAVLAVGQVHVEAGRPEQARPLYERALAIRSGKLGPAHQDTAASQAALGDLLARTGDDEGAKPLLTAAVTTLEAIEGVQPYELEARFDLARLRARAGEPGVVGDVRTLREAVVAHPTEDLLERIDAWLSEHG